MAQIIGLPCPRTAREPVSVVGWLMRYLRPGPRRLGDADELPERMRRDMGLTPLVEEPAHHHFDLWSSHRR
jgi:hypothetical protein